jgi:putative transposase
MNRGNRRQRLFHGHDDYAAFVAMMRRALELHPVRLYAWCLMPNHFHAVVEPSESGQMGRWVHRLLTAHVRREHAMRRPGGRTWQGRYKSCPVQDGHLLTVVRYVERNPLRAGLVAASTEWAWSSARDRMNHARRVPLEPIPGRLPVDWPSWLDGPVDASELEIIRQSTRSEIPIGDATWRTETAEELGLRPEYRRPGRPPRGPGADSRIMD